MSRQAISAATLVCVMSAGLLLAQPQAPPAGHWEGAIQIPAQELKIEVDLMKSGDTWEGTITVPAQNLKGFPLSLVRHEGNTVAFAMKIPGEPHFKGTLSTDGQSLSGDFSQGGGSVPFSLARKGDAKIEPQPNSTPIAKELEGSWEGTLDVEGTSLRLVLKLSTGADGAGAGTLISVDQGGAEIPVTAVVQKDNRLMLVVRGIAGTWEGDVADGVLKGTWTQGPATRPLVFTRAR